MRILLTGKNGQLGLCFQDVTYDSDHQLFAYDSSELDITNVDKMREILEDVSPDIIVNAAAYTAVDKAEDESNLAYSVNELGPFLLAGFAAKLNIPLIHISTDYVFDGKAVDPYSPQDMANPKNIYGASKYSGELALKSVLNKYIILRTSWVFSEYGNNFLMKILRLANERKTISVVADQYGCPTYAGDLAEAILKLCDSYDKLKSLRWGVFHYCGIGTTSWHGFARTICTKAADYQLITNRPKLIAVGSDFYTMKAKRPEFSVLDTSKLCDIDIKPKSWIKSIDKVIYKIKEMSV
ncbi:dTDP-4-dehydrorhamnose reductase [Marinomonas spartinae]|uniref:dTDP-4-dehydrorhamnose reductase n=1 Tax=Marinomonas spartinae TaxID=1792290 RepID=A0A1A8T4Y6_9GAMM|nr:dTDP-4-dehydrorhamnose reductase [Marinomonas spartinae]SBS27026.1 dTDP-4-dehydrorhamnose reductase [Marinomonas spartinae]